MWTAITTIEDHHLHLPGVKKFEMLTDAAIGLDTRWRDTSLEAACQRHHVGAGVPWARSGHRGENHGSDHDSTDDREHPQDDPRRPRRDQVPLRNEGLTPIWRAQNAVPPHCACPKLEKGALSQIGKVPVPNWTTSGGTAR